MSDQMSRSALDLTGLRKEWNTMRDEFHELVKSIPPDDFRRPTVSTRWSIAEILTHMMMSIEFIPKEIEAVRKNKDFLNFPKAIAGIGNLILIKIRARNTTPQALLDHYDRAFQAAMLAWGSLAEDEWDKGANFFGEGYRTLAENYMVAISHFDEHAAQIRESLR